MLISDLRDFLDRQEQEIRRHQREAKTEASEGRPIEVGRKASLRSRRSSHRSQELWIASNKQAIVR
jgi:hypothetical protein